MDTALPPLPPTDIFDFQPPSDSQYAARHQLGIQIPPVVPTPPPATENGPVTPIVPNHPEPIHARRRSTDRSRSGSPQQSRSRSRSPSRSSHHTGSEDGDSDVEESADPRLQWRPIAEDKSEPCEDELVYIESRAATEHCAMDHAHFEDRTFVELNDKQVKPLGSGRIDWLVERFNGTQEAPNNEQVMRSPTVHVGGYDWCIAFYPKGNGTEFLSLYLECVTMQQPDYTEFEPFEKPPFPFLSGAEAIERRRSVGAQISVVMYNPAEPRTYDFKVDAHRYSKQSADYGWRYLAHRDEFHLRRHGQRQALLRDDKLAFRAYIRVVDDPTRCMWAHDHTERFKDSLLTSGLRPFAGQFPHVTAILPLLHYEPFRKLITQQRELTHTIYKLQTLLWKLYSRTRSSTYGLRTEDLNPTDAVTCLRVIRTAVAQEVGDDVLDELLGPVNCIIGAGSLISSGKLKTKTCSSIQEAINKHPRTIATPALLTVELERQEFDPTARRWKKLTNRVEMNEHIVVGEVKYQLYSVVTHRGDLQSNKHNLYIRPDRNDILWYAYDDRRVTAMTHKQAVTDHEGFETEEVDRDRRRDSPFSGMGEPAENEVIYLALYIREDAAERWCHPKEEVWDVPEEIRKGLNYTKQKASRQIVKTGESAPDMPFRVEQDRHEEELRIREAMEAAAGASTPDWPLTDEEGDTIMSDAEEDEQLQRTPSTDMTASVTLAQIPEGPSPCRKWHTLSDCIGTNYYDGEMFGNCYQGHGHLITMSGDEYLGNFSQGRQEGHGKMIYASNGDVYEGEWKAGQRHGHGTFTEASTKNVFEGGWKEGKKHGHFVLKGEVTEEDRGLCTICYEREMTTAFYDCGHVLACGNCAAKIDNCPICRRRVVGRLQLYGVKMTLDK
ncbi:hypothetical protein LTR17_017750 [Elasticomyces elasticus]|nr:hypothetical protein LTR17_017750 [Elasticomyces elasticus]